MQCFRNLVNKVVWIHSELVSGLSARVELTEQSLILLSGNYLLLRKWVGSSELLTCQSASSIPTPPAWLRHPRAWHVVESMKWWHPSWVKLSGWHLKKMVIHPLSTICPVYKLPCLGKVVEKVFGLQLRVSCKKQIIWTHFRHVVHFMQSLHCIFSKVCISKGAIFKAQECIWCTQINYAIRTSATISQKVQHSAEKI